MMEEALKLAMLICMRFEGFYPRPYLCPAGVPTIGYGTTRYPDGRAVALTDRPIDEPHARRLLRNDLMRRSREVILMLGPAAFDTAGRLGAILDFAYNLGLGNLRSSTLRKRILAGRWEAVPAELRKWARGGGKVLSGLVKRREAEIILL